MSQQLNHDVAKYLLNHMPAGVLLVDQDNKIYWINEVLQEYVGIATECLVGCSVNGLNMQPAESTKNLYAIQNHKDNSLRWLLNVDALPVTSHGQTLTVRYFLDVSENIGLQQERQLLVDQLKEQATEDALTGFFNKKAIMLILESQVSRSRRYHNPLSVVLLELCSAVTLQGEAIPIDDQLILSLSGYLKDQLRWVDLIGRLDERSFVMILPETSKISALRLLEKLSKAFLTLPSFGDVENLIRVNCRLGTAEWQKGDDAALLMGKAERHLSEYQSN